MLFNTVEFALFLIVVCVLYYTLPPRFRPTMLLIASYFFYMRWKPEYGLLMFGVTTACYLCALGIADAKEAWQRRLYLYANVVIALGTLGYFKYTNFLIITVNSVATGAGAGMVLEPQKILLPVGISFFTFQAMSYTIDVYRGQLAVSRRLWDVLLYVAFFPQLVAGPIERAGALISQFGETHEWQSSRFYSGLRLILWGLFQKMVVADNLANYVDAVYANIPYHSGPTLILATVLFSHQMYADFAGYSSIARGAARLLGFELMENFRAPFMAQSMTEFWQRWHISLSTWLRDYVFISLGGSRKGRLRTVLNLMATMLVGGLWHGANWTFVVWGGMQGLILMGESLLFRRFPSLAKPHTGWVGELRRYITFVIRCAFGSLFRAESMSDWFTLVGQVMTDWSGLFFPMETIAGLAGLVIFRWVEISVDRGYAITGLFERRWVRYASYCALVYLVLLLGNLDQHQFIYFQF